MVNPYLASQSIKEADLDQDSTYQPSIFALNGRIGRLRYLGYMWLGYMLLGVGLAVMLPVLAPSAGNGNPILLLTLFYVPMIVWSMIVARRRLHDMEYSGWLSPLLFVPLLNFIFGLILLFKGGTEGKNKYGKPPAPNSPWIWLSVLIVPAIGILAAIALPAYQSYTQRAKMAQEGQRVAPPAPAAESGNTNGR